VIYSGLPGFSAALEGDISLTASFPVRFNSTAILFCSGALVLFAGGCQIGCKKAPTADVAATVDGKDILTSEVDKYYKNNLGDNPQKPSEEQAEIVQLNILHGMIEDEILQERATKLNLTASDEDVNTQITQMKALDTEEEFENRLKAKGLTLDDLKRDIRRKLTRDKLLNKEIESKINITDAEISGYYNEHKSEFNLIEPQYHLAQIVVTGAPAQQAGNLQNNKASGDADAKKKIQFLLSKLSNGEDFSNVAVNYSENANNASNGGDMGFVSESGLRSEPEAYNAISILKPGQISAILPVYESAGSARRTIGYAIYKLLDKQAAGQRELNDPTVQQRIRQQLRDSHSQLLRTAYLEMLHDQAKVRNYFAERILKEGAQ
jgi:peptidyl-prolyl cis-trans isomerase SurA